MHCVFLDATLSTCTVLRNCKRCDLIPKIAGSVLRAAAPIAPAAGHLPRRRLLHPGSTVAVAIATMSRRPSPIIWILCRCIRQRRQHSRIPSRLCLSNQCSLRCHRRAGSLPERIRRLARCDKRVRECWTGRATEMADHQVYRIASPSRRRRLTRSSPICRMDIFQPRCDPAVVSTPTSCTDRPRDRLIPRHISRTAKLCIRTPGIPRPVALRRHRRQMQPPQHQCKRRTCRLRQ